MSTEEVFVQQFAKLFVHYREALMLNSGSGREQQLQKWPEVPVMERDRLVTAARLALLELETNGKMEDDSRRFYAKPGEAEWGC